MKQFNFLKFLCITIGLTLTVMKSSAQTGNINGSIADENGIAFPGASVSIDAVRKGDISNFDGTFTILSVLAGKQTLSVSYLGYEDIKKEILVKENETITVQLELNSGSISLDDIVITS